MRPAQSLLSATAITKSGRICLFYFDQDLPVPADPSLVIGHAQSLPLSAIMLPKGLARAYYPPTRHTLPLIIQLNGKTTAPDTKDRYAPLVCTIDEAMQLGAKAVAYTLYLGSTHEAQMLQEFGYLTAKARAARLQTIAIIHISSHGLTDDRHSNMLAYAAQVALSLSADYVQLALSSDSAHYNHVAQAAGKCQVIADLAPSLSRPDQLQSQLQAVMSSGAAGLAFNQSALDIIAAQPDLTARLVYGLAI